MIKLQYRGSGSWKIASERRNVYTNLKVNVTVGGGIFLPMQYLLLMVIRSTIQSTSLIAWIVVQSNIEDGGSLYRELSSNLLQIIQYWQRQAFGK